jgi:hypothetical protein
MARKNEQWAGLDHSAVITERAFASSHAAFWNDLLPMGEHYIRVANRLVERFDEPLSAGTVPGQFGLVNELSFRLYAHATGCGLEVPELTADVLQLQAAVSKQFIESFRQHGRQPLAALGEDGLRDAMVLGDRIAKFFSDVGVPVQVMPRFPGCGWVGECSGDVLAGRALYEIKAGARSFRMLDVRQLLTYCALNFASKLHQLEFVGLMNPREGVYMMEPLNSLCDALAGRNAIDVLGDIVDYVSQCHDNYGV